MSKAVIWLALLSSVPGLVNGAPQTEGNKETEAVAEQPLLVVSSDQSNDEIDAISAGMTTIAGGVSMQTADQWQSQKSTNIKDILNDVPGVFVQQRNGAESARISVRGSGLGRLFQGGGLLLLLDGVPLNTADGSFDFQAIDPWLLDYVQVYRGANGMNMGGSTLGGVVNLGVRTAQGDEPALLRLAAGSFSTQQAMVSHNTGTAQQNLQLRASHFDQQGFRVQNQQNSNRMDLQYNFRNTANTQHRLAFYHSNTFAELPSSLSKGLLNTNPRQSRSFNINGNFHSDLTLSRLAYRIDHKHQTNSAWSANVYYFERDLINPVFTYINRDTQDVGFNLNWTGSHNSWGIHSQWGDQDERRRENESGLPGAERLFRQQDAQTTTAFFQHQRTGQDGRLTATFAVQGIYAQRNIEETFPQSVVSKRSYSQINPRLGLFFQSHANIQWFTNLSRSFEAPSFAELNNGNQPGINAPIKAQSADTFEIGSRGTTGNLSWDVAIYYSQVDDELIRFRFPDGATRSTNADRSTRLGFESALQWQLAESLFSTADQLSLQSNYQWTRFKLDQHPEFDNNRIPGVPEHLLTSTLQYQHPSGWTIGPNIEWVPSAYYVDLANSYRTDNYLLTGLSVSYTNNRGTQFYLDAKNLNDQTYISTSLPIPDAGGTDGNYFHSGEGRAFYAGIKWQF